MSNKGYIIGTFVRKNSILAFIERIKNDLNVNTDKLFVYKVETNDNEYLVTFKTNNKDGVKGQLQDSRIMHVKNGCLFSINALNKVIESKYGNDKPFNEVELDWNEFKNKLILLVNGELSIKNLHKIEDICSLFK